MELPSLFLALADDFLVCDELPEILEAHQQLSILFDGLQRIHSAQARAADARAIWRVNGAMARAHEFLRGADPWNGAAQVRADGGKHDQLA